MSLAAVRATVERRGRPVVADVSVEAMPGEVLVVVGPNGAGKTSLLAAMAGDLAPAQGRVTLDGRPLKEWDPLMLARRRAVMPQAARLGFSLPVHEVVALGRMPFARSHDRRANAAAIERAMAWADIAHLADRGFATLSGGEQQRVALARAVAQTDVDGDPAAPPVLLLDEPTASLDLAHAHAVLRLARALAARGVAVVAVLHDLGLAYRYADRVLVLDRGAMAGLGPPPIALDCGLIRCVFGVDAAVYDGHLVVRGPLAA